MSDTTRSIPAPNLISTEEFAFDEDTGEILDLTMGGRPTMYLNYALGKPVHSSEDLKKAVEQHNRKWLSAKWNYSAPKWIRREQNKKDRLSARRNICRSLVDDTLDALMVDRNNPLPYWD